MRVRELKLCHGKDSVTVALGIELGVVDDDLGDMYRLIVQVKLKISDLEMRLKIDWEHFITYALQVKNNYF